MTGCGIAVPVGVHRAVGGPHDAPTPGDILCAALAACQDSTVRMVANLMGVELEFLEVEVTADADVRGALAIDMQVPVGFQSMRCDVLLIIKMYGLRFRDYFGKMPRFPLTLILINFGADLFGPKLFQKMLFLSRGGISGRRQYSMSS
jgi:hypothetical protein